MKQCEFPPDQVSEICVNWHEAGKQLWYDAILGSIVPNKQNHSLSFELRPNNPSCDEEPFGMIIRHTGDTTTIKTDTLEDPTEEFDATLLTSTDELLVYALDEVSEIYVHVYLD